MVDITPACAGRDDHHQPARRPQRRWSGAQHPRHRRTQASCRISSSTRRSTTRLTALANRALFKDRVDQALLRTSARAPRWRCCSSTSTASRRSTTASATPPGTPADPGRPTGSGPAYGPGHRRPLRRRRVRRALEDASDDTELDTVAERVRTASASRSWSTARSCSWRRAWASPSGPRRRRADDLLRNADLAMYRAKAAGRRLRALRPRHAHRAGRPPRSWRPTYDGRSPRSFPRLPADRRPRVRASHGAEALFRWNHPTRGLVPPTEFIPLAEAQG